MRSLSKGSSVKNALFFKAWAKMYILFYIIFVYTFSIYGAKYLLNILLLHFTESVYNLSET